MPMIRTGPHTELYYTVDDYTNPWDRSTVEHVLLLHGMAESHKSWFAWIPYLARDYTVVRTDLPGLGKSTINVDEYEWSFATVAQDLNRLLDALNLQRVHVVGAKIGGSVALQLAANYPERVASVVSLGGPIWPKGKIGTNIIEIASLAPSIREFGVSRWARTTMPMRLGPDASAAQLRWWTNLMSTSNQDVLVKATTAVASADLRPSLPKIEAPALLMVSSVSGLSGDEAAEVWRAVPRGSREIIECGGYHISAMLPELCANHVLKFIRDSHDGSMAAPGQSSSA